MASPRSLAASGDRPIDGAPHVTIPTSPVTPSRAASGDLDVTVQGAIVEYLRFHGYTTSMHAFVKDCNAKVQADAPALGRDYGTATKICSVISNFFPKGPERVWIHCGTGLCERCEADGSTTSVCLGWQVTHTVITAI